MADVHAGELELELEQEFHEGGGEAGLEAEGWLGAIGNAVGSLLGESEFEDELEDEFEDESEFAHESEHEDETGLEAEGWLGAIGNAVGSLLGESEDEFEFAHEDESEDESEQFFGKIGSFLKKAAPILRKVAKVAAPIVGTAIGGPFGTILGKAASSVLESEHGEHGEHEFEDEYEHEAEHEMAHEIASHELSHHEALAEMLAESASHEMHEAEAEAMSGAATVTVISPADRRALRRILPHLVRGTAILTRILRRHRSTKPLVRVVPTIVRRTVKDLKRQAARGVPITRRMAGRAASRQVRKVLGSPRAVSAALTRNVRVSRSYKRPRRSSTAQRRRMR
jgi:hypothetical protein